MILLTIVRAERPALRIMRCPMVDISHEWPRVMLAWLFASNCLSFLELRLRWKWSLK